MKTLVFGMPTIQLYLDLEQYQLASLLPGNPAMCVINAWYIKHWAYLPVGSVKYPGMLYTCCLHSLRWLQIMCPSFNAGFEDTGNLLVSC